jgi:hypothetical protein
MKQQSTNRNSSRILRSPIAGLVTIAIAFILSFISFNTANAQFITTTTTEVQYPDATMTPTSLNLDNRNTKYLSNFSYPGTGPLTGSTIELSGWSTDNDGGFSYGSSTSGVYTGIGAMAIANAREVQVGYMEAPGGLSYIVASYYDVNKMLYGYDLYSWDLVTNIVAKLYTYHFTDPNFVVAEYVPTTGYHPGTPGSSFPVFVAPPVQTMDYNRISMDISKDANRIVIVLTDSATGYMYTATGMIAVDSIFFSPNLPITPVYPAASVTPLPPVDPVIYHFPYPATPGYVSGGGGTYYDYFDASTGIHARFVVSSGLYYYSYFPLDQWIYVTEYNGTTATQLTTSNKAFSPLIRLKAISYVTTPCLNEDYRQYWPDVAFSGEDNMKYVFYAIDIEDLYITNDLSSTGFMDMYNYIGNPVTPSSCLWGITDMQIVASNTGDGKPIPESSSTYYGPWNFESRCKSIDLLPGEEMRAKIDAPDLSTTMWAITFAYANVPAAGYFATYFPPAPDPTIFNEIFNLAEFGKHNIYVRYNGFNQAIMNNGSMLHLANNTEPNFSPTIAYRPMSSNVSVAWVSERAGAIAGSRWAYIGLEANTAIPTGTTSPASLVTLASYLYLSNTPSLDCGDHPLVSLSKHTDGLLSAYSVFTQEDASTTYSVMHKDHPWISTSFWKKTGINNVSKQTISVGPNPFSNTLHINSAEPLSILLMDVTGRTLADHKGATDELNILLDRKASQLAVGTYFLQTTNSSGIKEVFKLTKQ